MRRSTVGRREERRGGLIEQERLQRPSVLLALSALASLLLVFLSAVSIVDPDVFHEMALARAALERGSIPTEDLFAFTPTVSPSVHHEWGTGMVLYFVVTRLGSVGLIVLKYALGFAVALLTMKAARLQGAGWETLCSLAPIALPLVHLGFTNVRAQFFTLLFVSVLLVMTQWDRQGGRLWIAPWLLLYVVWLNMHGGFVVGVLLLTCHWLEEAVRHRRTRWDLIGCGMAMAGLTLVNPYGTAYLTYLWNALPMPRPNILEWQPIWASPNLMVLFGASLLAAAYAWVRGGDKPRAGWPAVVLFALAAGRHIRHASIYALVWMAFVPAWFDTTPMGRDLRLVWARHRGLVISGSLAVILAGVGLSVSFEPWRLRVPVDGQDLAAGAPILYPAGAVQYLGDSRFQGNVMTRDVEGSYVSWHLYPAVKVGLDGRYEVAFKPGVAEETLAFFEGLPGWEQTLARYPTDLVLVGQTDPIGRLLTDQTQWHPVYHDDVFTLFARPALMLPYLDARGKKIEARFP